MIRQDMAGLRAEISALRPIRMMGRVSAVQGNALQISGLSSEARLGDRVVVQRRSDGELHGEVIRLEAASLVVLPDTSPDGVALGDRVILGQENSVAPSHSWLGRIIDPFGQPLDGRPLLRGANIRALRADPPAPTRRRTLGARLETGMVAFNTVLPIVRGQRVGLFAGSGVGKSMLLGHLARHMQADVVVIALIGERGRELREFVETVLGPEGMRRSVIVAATSDRSPLIRRRCAWTAMAVASSFVTRGSRFCFLPIRLLGLPKRIERSRQRLVKCLPCVGFHHRHHI